MFTYALRIGIQWFKSRRQAVGELGEEYITDHRSWLTDCDMNLHVNTARYFVYMEVARFDIGFRTGLYSYCLREKIASMVMATKITFRREIKPFQKFKIKTKILGFDSRFLYFEQIIFSPAGTHAKAFVRLALYGAGVFVEPESLVSKLGVKFENQEFPDDLKAWIQAEALSLKSMKA